MLCRFSHNCVVWQLYDAPITRSNFCSQVVSGYNSVRGSALNCHSTFAVEETERTMLECCAILVSVPALRKLGPQEQATHIEACKAMLEIACPAVLQLFQHVRAISFLSAVKLYNEGV